MKSSLVTKVLIAILLLIVFFLSWRLFSLIREEEKMQFNVQNKQKSGQKNEKVISKLPADIELKNNLSSSRVVKFKSPSDFKEYLRENYLDTREIWSEMPMPIDPQRDIILPDEAVNTEMRVNTTQELGQTKSYDNPALATTPHRVSTTNVQVVGIDEPDIVKTNGKNLFVNHIKHYSIKRPQVLSGRKTTGYVTTRRVQEVIKNFQAFPPADLKLIEEVEATGEMLLGKDRLIVLDKNNAKILGFNIDRQEGKLNRSWEVKLADKTSLNTARLVGDKVYLILENNLKRFSSCPVEIFKDSQQNTVSCQSIYHLSEKAAVNTLFTVVALNLETGQRESQVSFLGTNDGRSVIYVSPRNIYVAYQDKSNEEEVLLGAVLASSFLPPEVKKEIEMVGEYKLSPQIKTREIEKILDDYIDSLPKDEQLVVQNNAMNEMEKYIKENLEKLSTTIITKVDLNTLSVKNVGEVPGNLLNQFSLDEYNGNLRVATTIGFRNEREMSKNDVYVLDTDLKIVGSVKDLGRGERIYAVRFIDNRGYVVTFRETDPFYVIDLSNPREPKLAGELKIPGYSSYLHKLADNLILGIGKQDGKVKLSLFDVSDSFHPQEVAKYTLDDYYSEAINNHHAFLQDAKHQVFFLPGSRGGYIFSYRDKQLQMLKAVAEANVKRAVYINDYLYLITADKIVVFNENDWVKVKELEYNEN